MDPDRSRTRARLFDRDPQAYLRGRPSYPAKVYEILTAECGLGPGCRVLEIGAGTGQATADLLVHGAEVVAVEPGTGLASVLAERFGERFGERRLSIINADFEDADPPPGPYQLVVSATAFHWVDPAIALPKIAKLLSPDGTLAVWWTVFADPERSTEFRTALDAVYERQLPHLRRDGVAGPLRAESWSEELQRGGWFGPVTVDVVRWTHRLTAETARLLWSTFSNIGELEPPARQAFLDELTRVVEDFGGVIDDPRVTTLYRTHRT